MKVALVNPPWRFEGSVYFGCREPHLPLEYGYARALLARDGHDARVFDAQLGALDLDALAAQVAAFEPDMTVVTSAPSYLFWRCAPPELRVPMETVQALRASTRMLVVVGPHASTTPGATIAKLGCDVVVLGECEEVLTEIARQPDLHGVRSIAFTKNGALQVKGGTRSTDMRALPALRWEKDTLARHAHHHHRFDAAIAGAGAEIEASRGCPFHCTFCAKDNFRDDFRKRPLDVVLDELDALVASGVRYVYFIDEIFVPDRPLLEAVAERKIAFGVQMRIDHWSRDMLDLLGRAGCVSVEAGVESITPEGRSLLAKRCRLTTAELTDLLVYAKKRVSFVQANLLGTHDDPRDVATWRAALKERGVWANEPVPLFPYPGSPEYTKRWGTPDDSAWERAHAAYLEAFDAFSDIQEARPLPLPTLEGGP